MAAGVSDNFCSFLETEVTLIASRSSRLMFMRSGPDLFPCARSVSEPTPASNASRSHETTTVAIGPRHRAAAAPELAMKSAELHEPETTSTSLELSAAFCRFSSPEFLGREDPMGRNSVRQCGELSKQAL